MLDTESHLSFFLGQYIEMPRHWAQIPLLSPSSEEVSWLCSSFQFHRSEPAAENCTVFWDSWLLLRNASSAEIYRGCWDLHSLLISLPASRGCTGCWVLRWLLGATSAVESHPCLFFVLSSSEASSHAKFFSTLNEARLEKISQAAFQNAGYIRCTLHSLLPAGVILIGNWDLSWCLPLPTWSRGKHR